MISISIEMNLFLPDIKDDRPIKGSQTGGYNLNFIDWNNEWEHILDGGNGTGEDDPNLIGIIPLYQLKLINCRWTL